MASEIGPKPGLNTTPGARQVERGGGPDPLKAASIAQKGKDGPSSGGSGVGMTDVTQANKL